MGPDPDPGPGAQGPDQGVHAAWAEEAEEAEVAGLRAWAEVPEVALATLTAANDRSGTEKQSQEPNAVADGLHA